MKQILESLNAKSSDLAIMIVFSSLGFIVYVLSQEGTMKVRLKGAALGFFISMSFAYPVYSSIGADKWWALAAMSSILTICGQFLPELFTIAFRKFVKKYINDKFGVDTDDR